MPIIIGLSIGIVVFGMIWAVAGPFVALINFVVGRFFIASVIMTVSLFCWSCMVDDFKVTPENYKTLLVLGLILEGIKWAVVLWWRTRQEEPTPINIVIRVMDNERREPDMRDITPQVRRLR